MKQLSKLENLNKTAKEIIERNIEESKKLTSESTDVDKFISLVQGNIHATSVKDYLILSIPNIVTLSVMSIAIVYGGIEIVTEFVLNLVMSILNF